MKSPNEISRNLEALEAKLNRQLQEYKDNAKADLIEYIIARFKEVSYAEQALSLFSKADKSRLDGLVFGSSSPCRHFYLIGMQKVESPAEIRQAGGPFYTGERKYYVEKQRQYRKSDWEGKFRWCLDDTCELTYDQLMEIALCLKEYQHPVYAHSAFPGISYSWL